MIQLERKIWQISLILLLTLWLGGCSTQYDGDEQKPWDGNLNLLLNITSGDSGKSISRAVDYFQQTTIAAEKMQSLRVIIVNNGNRDGSEDPYSGQIVYNRYIDIESQPGLSISGDPDLRFKVDFSKKYRIYLIANEAGIPEERIREKLTSTFAQGWFYPSEEEQLEDLIISAEDAGNPILDNVDPNSATPIPMTERYEITTIDKPEVITEESLTQEESFFITRAASKFSFILKKGTIDTDYNNFIKSIKLTGLGTKEYLLPNNATYDPPIEEESSNEDGGREITGFEIPADNPVGEYPFVLPEAVNVAELSDEGYSFAPELYFPESKGNPEKDKFQCSISFDGETFLAPVTLPNLNLLPRNTHAIITITVNGHDLEAVATVYPYTGVWLNPAFGFNIPVNKVIISERSQEGDLKPIEAIELREGESIDLIGTVEPANANNQDLVWTSGEPKVVSVSEIGRVTAIALPEGMSEYTVSITAMAADGSGAKATCKVKVIPKIPVESITVSPATWSGNIGSTTSLTATILPETATVQDVKWESSDTAVASVSSYGVVTAVGPGDATITAVATDGSGKSATCSVHVNEKIPVTSVTLSAGPSGTFYAGEQFSFNATVEPSNATNQELKWESSNPEIATVSSYGLVTAIKEGEVTITATAVDGSEKKAPQTIYVTNPEITLSRGGNPVSEWTTTFADPKPQIDVRATITPANVFKGIVWTSSDESVATIEDAPKYNTNNSSVVIITAQGKGTAVITATSSANPDVSATYKVTVN